MRKTGKKREKEQNAGGQLRFPLEGLARQALWDTVVLSGFSFVQMSWKPSAPRCVVSAMCIRSIGRQCAGPRAELAGVGWAASRDPATARSQYRWPRTALAELAGVEFARSAR